MPTRVSKQRRSQYNKKYYTNNSHTPRSRAPWTEEEKQLVATSGLTDREISNHIGRSLKAITAARSRLRKGREIPNKATPKQKTTARFRERARQKTRYAIRTGKLKPSVCVVCGNSESEPHHKDYSKPYAVVWMCRPCHERTHIQEKHSRR